MESLKHESVALQSFGQIGMLWSQRLLTNGESAFVSGLRLGIAVLEEIRARQIPERWPGALLMFNTFFGWLMTTLFVAGVSGLIRTNRD